MKYYIATSLSRMAAHNRVRDALTTLGHAISYDWTLDGNVKCVSKEGLREVAILELDGISRADFVLVLLPGGNGTHVELGFAIASGKRVFLHTEDPAVFELGPQTKAFYHHPDVIRLCCPLPEIATRLEQMEFFVMSQAIDNSQ